MACNPKGGNAYMMWMCQGEHNNSNKKWHDHVPLTGLAVLECRKLGLDLNDLNAPSAAIAEADALSGTSHTVTVTQSGPPQAASVPTEVRAEGNPRGLAPLPTIAAPAPVPHTAHGTSPGTGARAKDGEPGASTASATVAKGRRGPGGRAKRAASATQEPEEESRVVKRARRGRGKS